MGPGETKILSQMQALQAERNSDILQAIKAVVKKVNTLLLSIAKSCIYWK